MTSGREAHSRRVARRRPRSRPPRSRWALLLGAAIVIGSGVTAKLLVPGLTGDLLGSACYTALLFVVAAIASPKSSGSVLAGFALLASALVEVLQLTPLPAAAGNVFPPARWVLGSTFVASDLIGYALGALVVFGLDRLAPKR